MVVSEIITIFAVCNNACNRLLKYTYFSDSGYCQTMLYLRNIFTALTLLTLACILPACSKASYFDIPETEPGQSERPLMSITVAMSGTSPTGASAQGFQSGEGLENYLDIANDNFRIYFFDTDNKFIDVFRPYVFSFDSDDNLVSDRLHTVSYVQFRDDMPDNLPHRFKIVALFNWPAYPVEASESAGRPDELVLRPGVTTIEDLCTHSSAQFEALMLSGDNDSWLTTDGKLIPFYGVREYNLDDYVDFGDKIPGGTIIDLGRKGGEDTSIPLLRSMAKVEVILDNPLASFAEVVMTRVNRKGFCAPYRLSTAEKPWNYDHTDYFPNGTLNWDKNYVRGVHLTYGAGSGNKGNGTNDATANPLSVKFKKVNDRMAVTDENGITTVKPEKWVAYVPEYKNIGVDDFTTVRVRLKKPDSANDAESTRPGEEQGYYKDIYFAANGKADGERFDIERNNLYRFNVSGMTGNMTVSVDIQPFAESLLTFEFGLMRDERGDLMVLPIPKVDENGNPVIGADGKPVMTYPDYFLNFINDSNPNHKYPQEEDEFGNPTTGLNIVLEEGDYYAIVVGEYEDMSEAVVWVKDKDGCHVLSNLESKTDDQECNARLVESFFGNNQSERFFKDAFGYRRVYHFDNHNSIVRHPKIDNLLFRYIENFQQENQTYKYYEVESWDESTMTGWVINRDADGTETSFQEITSDGELGAIVPINGFAD